MSASNIVYRKEDRSQPLIRHSEIHFFRKYMRHTVSLVKL